jgi:hypothetical protein
MPSLPRLAAAAVRTTVDTTRAVLQLPQALVDLNRSVVRLTATLDALSDTARETLANVGDAAAQVEKLAADATPLLTGLKQTQGTVSALAGAAGLFARRARPEPERPTITGTVVDPEVADPEDEDPASAG